MGTNGSTMLDPLRQGLPPVDPASVREAASCALSSRLEGVGEARQFARSTLGGWGLGELTDDIALVVSELVTNALRHALPSTESPTAAAASCAQDLAVPESPVRLHLMRWTGRLMCAVRDPSEESPVAQDGDDFSAECGRGLFLVDSFSDSWGWHPLAGTLRGKMVWALFRL